MTAIIKTFLEAFLGAFTGALLDWLRDRDAARAHEEIGARRVEAAQQKDALDAVREKQQIEDDIARLSPDERRRRLQQWERP